MKPAVLTAALAFATLSAGAAFAAEKCDVPMAEWQPKEALQKKLEGEGWKIRQIKTENGCYETYAIDSKGKRVEAYFNPKTLEPVDKKSEG